MTGSLSLSKQIFHSVDIALLYKGLENILCWLNQIMLFVLHKLKTYSLGGEAYLKETFRNLFHTEMSSTGRFLETNCEQKQNVKKKERNKGRKEEKKDEKRAGRN